MPFLQSFYIGSTILPHVWTESWIQTQKQHLPWVDVGFTAFKVVVQVVSEQVNQVYCVISRVSL